MHDGESCSAYHDLAIDLRRTALFFDFDGTLAAIVENPADVAIEPGVTRALARLHEATCGALAIVSGRPIETLDSLLQPLKLPIAGVHGLEWRGHDGRVHRGIYDDAKLARIRRAVSAFVDRHPALSMESKPGSVALHYRRGPHLEGACQEFAQRLSETVGGVSPIHGKMVVELRLGGRNKADAVAQFMSAPPFRGRAPLFVGDDVTDEDALRKVEQIGGTGVKIGSGVTTGSARFADRADFMRWLHTLAAGTAGNGPNQTAGGHHLQARRAGVNPAPRAGTAGAKP